VLSGLMRAMARYGHRLRRTSCAQEGAGSGLVEALRRQRPVVVVADTFHLEHFWMDHGKTHALHSLVVRDFDPADRTVRLTDAVDLVFLDERVPLARVEAALFGEYVHQEWLSVEAWGDAPAQVSPSRADLSGLAAELAGAGTDGLGGTELVALLTAMLDDLFLLTDKGVRTAEAHPWWLGHVQIGLWNYHHSLRWCARHLRIGTPADPARGAELRQAASAVERACQDVLVVRALLRQGENPDPARAVRHREEVARRLARMDADLRTSAASLTRAAEEGADR
jgi:hypothetical protein